MGATVAAGGWVEVTVAADGWAEGWVEVTVAAWDAVVAGKVA